MKKEAIISLLELFPLIVYAVPVIKSNTRAVLDNACVFYFLFFFQVKDMNIFLISPQKMCVVVLSGSTQPRCI